MKPPPPQPKRRHPASPPRPRWTCPCLTTPAAATPRVTVPTRRGRSRTGRKRGRSPWRTAQLNTRQFTSRSATATSSPPAAPKKRKNGRTIGSRARIGKRPGTLATLRLAVGVLRRCPCFPRGVRHVRRNVRRQPCPASHSAHLYRLLRPVTGHAPGGQARGRADETLRPRDAPHPEQRGPERDGWAGYL